MAISKAHGRLEAKAQASASQDALVGRKVAQVAAAAWKVFMAQGFQATSMDAVAREAGVSKATLYAYFPGKEALFAHLITAECEAIAARIQAPDLDRGLEDALRSFARQYIGLFLSPEPRLKAFFPVLSAEGGRFPELSQLFFKSGPDRDIVNLARCLEEAKRRGLLELADGRLAAIQFLSLIRGELPLHATLGLPMPPEAEIDRTVESGLALFLRGYAPR